MKYKQILSIIGIIFFIKSCGNTHTEQESGAHPIQSNLVIIDPDYSEVKDTIFISQFIDSLIYIPLQQNQNCILSSILKVVIADAYIFVHDASSLYMFQKDGSYLRTISTSCWGFDILRKNQFIFVADGQKIVVYNYQGDKVQNDILLSQNMVGIGNFFLAIDSCTIALSIWNKGVEPERLMLMQTDGTIVKTFPNYEQFKPQRTPLVNASRFHRTLFRYHDSIRYHPYYADTLFTLSNDTLQPVFVEKKIKKVPLQYRLENLGDESAFRLYCHEHEAYTTRFFETSRYVFVIYNIGYITQTLPSYLLYDKITAQLYNYKQEFNFSIGSLHLGLYNDFDGGLPFNPEYLSDEYLIEAYSATKFIRDYNEGRSITECDENNICISKSYDMRSNRSNNLEQTKLLEDLLQKIKVGDNPVLIIAKLKENL